MERKWISIGLVLTTACLLARVSAFGAGGDKIKAKGMIISRTGDTLVLTNQGEKVTVIMDDSSKVQQPTGLVSKKRVSAGLLIPGLKIAVDGVSDDKNRIIAKSITFDPDDLEIAEMIQAGLHPTAEQVAASEQEIASHSKKIASNQQATAANSQRITTNEQTSAANKVAIEQNIKDIEETTDRFNRLAEYDVKGNVTVNFKTGSSAISMDSEAKLQELAQKATTLTGYMIEVKGFSDSSGNATMNTKLSEDRARNVITYLIQQCGVPVRHVLAPGAYGETFAAASNETASGRAENRRVEVQVLVNKGITGM